ncbi:MAG TPA: hypothetical protein VFD02_05185 [Syntrophomonadaceae bacterium]|nr:hypothetical protein [Syntrophomonadaceae bacterium]
MRYLIIGLIATLLCLFNLGAAEASILSENYTPASQASPEENLIIRNIAESFDTYTHFFIDLNICGANFEDSLAFLTRSFNEEIAFNLLDYYAYSNNDGKLVAKAQESIPIFTINDIPRTRFCTEGERITLKVDYYDCYEIGDHYLYYITAHAAYGKYIINDLYWEEVDTVK